MKRTQALTTPARGPRSGHAAERPRPSQAALYVAAIMALLVAGGLMAAPAAVRWRHLSSKAGEIPTPPGSLQQTLCLAMDVNHDRRQDFVIGCRGKGPALVWYRRDARGWAVYPIDTDATPIEAGGAALDVDRDGDLDLIAGNDYQGPRVFWYENPYPRYDLHTPWKRHVIKSAGANQHHDQIVGDFDRDGRPDLVFWNQGAQKLFLARVPADPRVEPWPFEPIYSGAGEGLAQGDVDGDGKPDLLAGGRWFELRNGSFVPHVIDDRQSASRVAAGDLNGDGKLDVVMVPGDGVGRLVWYEQRGDPRDPKSWVAHDLLGADVIHGHSLDVADLNNDRHPDIFCAEMGKWHEAQPQADNPNPHVWVFYGDGRGGFTKTQVSSGIGAHEARVADLNGDGRLDILSKPYNWDTPRLDIWLNQGR